MPIVQLYLDSYLNYDHKVLFRLSGIQTRIVGVEGEHADHLTTTTAHRVIIECLYDCPQQSGSSQV